MMKNLVSMTEAIRLFLTQVSLRQEFPIELKIPKVFCGAG
jgi:antitoxin component of RelBE/YafQ-DinJ toxin-antitoxin module